MEVFEHMWGLQMPPNIWGVNSMSPSDFEQFLLLEGVAVLKELILNIVEVDFLWNRTVDSLKTSFHPLLWTSSGLKE